MNWRLLVEPEGLSGVENMARDEALLDEAVRAGTHLLRLYRWDPPCLSLGRNQRRGTAMPCPYAPDIPTVRRPTGGRAVWHEHEVTYAVAAPIATFGSLREAYLTIHRRLAAALRMLGVDAKLADRPDRRSGLLTALTAPTACFAVPAGGEILARGRKLVGSAQVRRGAAFLQHGSILLDGTQAKAAVRGARYAVRGDIALREVLDRVVTFEEVAEAIVDNWDALAPLAVS